MADLADHDPQTPGHDDQAAANAAAALDSSRAQKRRAPEDDDDDDEKPGRERRKIDIKFITDKSRRHITFSKRKAGIMKKVSISPDSSGSRINPIRCAGLTRLATRY